MSSSKTSQMTLKVLETIILDRKYIYMKSINFLLARTTVIFLVFQFDLKDVFLGVFNGRLDN